MHHHRYFKGEPVTTKEKTICSANILEVECGTNGYKGGDAGHGSRTFIRITDAGGTNMKCRVAGCGINGIEILLCGDAELESICKALKYIRKTLLKQIHNKAISQAKDDNGLCICDE